MISSTSTVYNSLGQVSQTTDAAGLVIKYTYDSAGNQITQTEVLPNGIQILSTATFNADNRVIATTDGLNHTTETTYNGDGQVDSGIRSGRFFNRVRLQ